MDIFALISRTFLATPSKVHIVLPLLFMAIIYVFSSLPGRPLPNDAALQFWMLPILQNALHIPAYAALTLALRWSLRAWLHLPQTVTLSACGIAIAYALFDEWHQGFVLGRFSSLADVALDLAGVALGMWLYTWIRSRATSTPSDTKSDGIKT